MDGAFNIYPAYIYGSYGHLVTCRMAWIVLTMDATSRPINGRVCCIIGRTITVELSKN